MAKQALIAIGGALLIGGTIVECSAASGLRLTCAKEMDEIERICGLPGTIDTPAENQCRIRAIVSPDPSLPQITGSYTEFLRCGR